MTAPRVRLILSIDGTNSTEWGVLDSFGGTINGVLSSVRRIHDMVKEGIVTDANGIQYDQRARYLQGVATTGVSKETSKGRLTIIQRAWSGFQGTTGFGYMEILKSAYRLCCENLAGKDDEIWIFGYSRGSFIARALASFLEYVGLIKPDAMTTDSAYNRRFYDQVGRYALHTGVNRLVTTSKDWLLPFATESPVVRFIGAFDTVKAVFPLPRTEFVLYGIPMLDFLQDAPRLVKHFRHAVALNEARPFFLPSLWNSTAHLSNTGASFLEAWFFGYHADLGGSNARRGLALWPLQWMLTSAIEEGLVLESSYYKHPILFTGAVQPVSMPHQPKMAMTDMMKHHAADGRYRLLLHELTPMLQAENRDYRRHLTLSASGAASAASATVASQVYLHPAAYLQFNISSSFRIQLYEWKRFRNFVQDRAGAVPAGVPWWEAETEKNLLQEILPLRQMRLLIFGAAGSGKLAMIESAFGQVTTTTPASAGIDNPLPVAGNDLMNVHFSDGVTVDTPSAVKKFIDKYRVETDIEKQLHAIWYCIDFTKGPPSAPYLQFSALDFGTIPVIVVLTKADEVKTTIRAELAAKGLDVTDENVEHEMESRIAAKRTEINGRESWSFLPVENSVDSVKELLTATFQRLENPRIQLTEIRAQTTSVRLKLAIATDQILRAYAVWRAFAFKSQSVVFRRRPPGALLLTDVLMEPILDSFQSRLTAHAALIKSQLGGPWQKQLDKCPTTMWQAALPGNLILYCMVDTMIVLARVMPKPSAYIPNALRRTTAYDANTIRSACTWYLPRQAAVHTQIKALLATNSSPKENSIAFLQLALMDVIETGMWSRIDSVGEGLDMVAGTVRDSARLVGSFAQGGLATLSGLKWGTAHEVRRGLFS